MLVATNTGDVFRSCSETELPCAQHTAQGFMTTPAATTFHLTAEERRRAAEAYDLCAVLRHPGDAAVISALDGGASEPRISRVKIFATAAASVVNV